MTAPLLSFQNVTFGYRRDRQPFLQDVTFDLHPGRITAILGPNGAGKTTLLYLALGWLAAWTGGIRLDGLPLRQHSRLERGRWLALVPQNEHTPFDYTVLEYALMGRAPHMPPLGIPAAADYDAALQALDQVGLAALAEHPVPQLSGGEHQLMLLARAVAQRPRLLLLDEPTAHLDLRNKSRLIQMMKTLRTEGVTLLMTNHEPEVVLAVADDVLLMEPGRPPLFGPLEQALTAEALSRVYGLPIRLVDVDGHKQVLWT
ncbi:MAG: iron complex transport system ATP-binding protein [Anaerolineaceae bacterium]|nr:MAG: iron complex transport system ATP-binding protein [Anaerolineaceae bacterium]